jgi:DNA processing protein
MSENTRTILALSQLPRVGRVRLRNILERIKSEVAAFRLSDLVHRFSDLIPSATQQDIEAAEAKADEILERCEKLHITVYYFGGRTYPSQLGRLSEPPSLLFSMGRFDFDRRPRIAVIGTRKPTDWGLQTAKACAAQIAESQGVVVSGLALGIDAAAQESSVEHDSPTWAVLAHGLHTVSPSSNRELAKRILDKGGALISEYAPGEPAQRHYFVERDRIQAGLSDAVLVIESGVDGGAMHTVRFAQQAHVNVWVTFPDAKLQDAQTNRAELPEPQQGTWELLIANKAARVSSVKALGKMMRELPVTTDTVQ